MAKQFLGPRKQRHGSRIADQAPSEGLASPGHTGAMNEITVDLLLFTTMSRATSSRFPFSGEARSFKPRSDSVDGCPRLQPRCGGDAGRPGLV